MCGSSSSSSTSKSVRKTDNSRTDSRMAASGEAVVIRGKNAKVEEVSDEALKAAGDTLKETATRAFDEAGGWREFVTTAYETATDLTKNANRSLETVATTTAKSDDLEVTEQIVKLGIPAAALVAGAYFLGR